MSNETIQILTPIINIAIIAILSVIGGLITRVLVKVLPVLINFLQAKLGLANYNKLKAFATDIFYKIEEDGRLGQLVDTKIITFESLIKTKYPEITNAEIEIVRQAIAGEFNKDKPAVIKAIEQPVETVTVTPIVKYVDPNGVELQPIVQPQ